MTGTITRRKLAKGVSWGFSFFAGRDAEGKRQQVTKSGFETRKAAAAALAEALDRHRKGLAVVKDVRTFGEFLSAWLSDTAAKRTTPKTLEAYTQHIQRIVTKLGKEPLSLVTPAKLEKALWALLENGGKDREGNPRPLSARTVRHTAATVGAAFKDAVRLGQVDSNPMDRVKLPTCEQKRPEALGRSDISRLFAAAAGTVLYPIVALALATGARRGELLALTWADVDLERGAVSISKSLEQVRDQVRVKPTKSKKPRVVALPASAVAILRQHQAEQAERHTRARELYGDDFQELGLVFCGPDGALYHPDRVGARVCELSKSLGLKAGLHKLRHQHASESLSAGVPLPAVSSRLGHANPSITSAIYSHALGEDERAAAEQWDRQFGGVLSAKPARC